MDEYGSYDGSFLFWIVVISLSFSAFFSGIEIAFISANKLRLAINSKKSGWFGRIMEFYQHNPARFITTTLVGNNIALVVFGIFMSEALNRSFLKHIHTPWIEGFLATLLSTLVVLILAEYLPKLLFRLRPILTLKSLIFPFHVFYFLFWPLIQLALFLSNSILKFFTNTATLKPQNVFGQLDLTQIVENNPKIKLDDDKSIDSDMFKNALDFRNSKVRDCMTPRTHIVAFDIQDGAELLYKTFTESRHSKIPVYEDNIDNLIGYVHQVSMFLKPKDIRQVLFPLVVTNESMSAAEVLRILIKANRSMAVVVDEFGGTAGLITIEDIMEEIFGEIEDEYDKEDLKEVVLSENHFVFSARHEIDYLNKNYGLDIPPGDYDTLGGFVIFMTQNIPTQNEMIQTPLLSIKVLKVDNGRVEELEVTKV